MAQQARKGLEEQANLLQELRDEQERLRDEQEKIKDNEQRIGEKNNKSGAAQSGSAGPGSLQRVNAAFDACSYRFDASRTVLRTALQQLAQSQEQYKREAEWSAEEHGEHRSGRKAEGRGYNQPRSSPKRGHEEYPATSQNGQG